MLALRPFIIRLRLALVLYKSFNQNAIRLGQKVELADRSQIHGYSIIFNFTNSSYLRWELFVSYKDYRLQIYKLLKKLFVSNF